jgi:hypothetical protein
MNLRLFSMAVLVSALPMISQAQASRLSLNHGDFVAAGVAVQEGEAVVKVKLSKSGKAKLKKLNAESFLTEIGDK